MFPIIRVNADSSEELEPLGTKRKFWFMDAQQRRMLFKAEERGTGEDWAEKVACAARMWATKYKPSPVALVPRSMEIPPPTGRWARLTHSGLSRLSHPKRLGSG